MASITDVAVTRDSEGVYDATIDPVTRDLVMTQGLGSALLISLFSDRRARADEVAEPLKRRGWIGDVVADDPDDRHGSGIWLYEQRRVLPEVASGVRLEAEAALQWMVQDGLATSVSATVTADPANRTTLLNVEITNTTAGPASPAFVLADATRKGLLYGN